MFLKTLKISIFSFYHNVFYPSKNKISNILSHMILLSANAFNLDQYKIFPLGKD